MFAFVAGRDTKFRPIIHISAARVNDAVKQGLSLQSMYEFGLFMLEQIKHYMMLPGQIENYTLIVDVEKKSLTDLPLNVKV